MVLQIGIPNGEELKSDMTIPAATVKTILLHNTRTIIWSVLWHFNIM